MILGKSYLGSTEIQKIYLGSSVVYELSGGGLETKNARLIVGNASSLDTNDLKLKGLLEANIGTVQVVNDVQADYDLITGYDFTILSYSVAFNSDSSLLSETKPILTINQNSYTSLKMSDGQASSSVISITIPNPHPITDGITSPFDYNLGGALVAQRSMTDSVLAFSTAFVGGLTTTRNQLIAYSVGDTLADGSSALGKRVYIAGQNANQWSADVDTIFVNSLNWFLE